MSRSVHVYFSFNQLTHRDENANVFLTMRVKYWYRRCVNQCLRNAHSRFPHPCETWTTNNRNSRNFRTWCVRVKSGLFRKSKSICTKSSLYQLRIASSLKPPYFRVQVAADRDAGSAHAVGTAVSNFKSIIIRQVAQRVFHLRLHDVERCGLRVLLHQAAANLWRYLETDNCV